MSPRDSTEIGERVAPDVKLKNKPKPSKLRQQKLPAWQPILTASTVIPTVLCVGLVFIPIGIALFLASESVQEYKLDYTNCTLGSLCTLTLDVKEDMEGDVYFYYYLENFYQNHRRYVKSRNDKQYLGELDQTSDCEPFATKTVGGNSIPIAPCGAVANSMFNDTFRITYTEAFKNLNVPVTATGITWDVDINKKFKNPPIPAGQTLCDVFKNTVRPPNWTKDLCLMGGFTNPDFIVWMRTAALPNFRKLWRRLDRSQEQVLTPDFQNGLPKGSYQIFVENNYPVTSFGGRKAFIVSTTSWAGGKNSFLGIAYLVVGSLAIVLAVVFIVIHVKFGHSVNELSNVAPAHQ